MTITERIRIESLIRELARRNRTSPAAIRRDIQEAIDEAWDNKTPSSAAAWLEYFPDGEKPTVEVFICRLGTELRRRNEHYPPVI